MRRADKRRHLLVNRRLQLELVLFLVWLLAVAIATTWLLTYFLTWNHLVDNLARSADLPGLFRETSASLLRSLAATAGLLVACGLWIFIYLTHRIAGPASRIEKTLAGMADGRWPARFELRPRDHLVEVGRALERLIAAEAGRRQVHAARLAEITALLEAADRQAPGREPKIREALMLLARAGREGTGPDAPPGREP